MNTNFIENKHNQDFDRDKQRDENAIIGAGCLMTLDVGLGAIEVCGGFMIGGVVGAVVGGVLWLAENGAVAYYSLNN